ncbi:hypothetical protein KAW65_03220 [candidate division WOR-3 bacterium]|nr:hypothetical protein [candidate division WOR-3 bacterium]
MSISFQKAPNNHDSLKNQTIHNICDFIIDNPDYLDELDQLLSKKNLEKIGKYINYFRRRQRQITYKAATYIDLIEELCNLNNNIIIHVEAAILELLLEKLIRRQLKPHNPLIETECFVFYNGNKIEIGEAGEGNIDVCAYLASHNRGFFYECKINVINFLFPPYRSTMSRKDRKWMNSFDHIPSEVGDNKILLRLATMYKRIGCENAGVDTKLKESWLNVKAFCYEDIEFLLSSEAEIGDFSPL